MRAATVLSALLLLSGCRHDLDVLHGLIDRDAGPADGAPADGPHDAAGTDEDAAMDASADSGGRDGGDGDAGVDASIPCDASLSDDPDHCGACGHVCTAPGSATPTCTDGLCGFEAEATDVTRFSLSLPLAFYFLAAHADGRVLVTGAPTAKLVTATGETSPFTAVHNQPTVWIDSAGTTRAVINGYQDVHVMAPADGEVLHTLTYGCCNVHLRPYSVEPTTGVNWHWKSGWWRWDLDTGMAASALTAYAPGDTYLVSDRVLYSVGEDVCRVSIVTGGAAWCTPVPRAGGAPREVALTADEGVVIADPGSPHRVSHVRSDGTLLWQVDVEWYPATYGLPRPVPVITGEGLIVVPDDVGPADGTGDIVALRPEDGSVAWRTDVGGYTHDIIVGEGVIYAGVDGGSTHIHSIVGLDPATGALRHRYTALPPAYQLLLLDGLLFAAHDTGLLALEVEAMRYDPASPWPTRFHDNQRTMNLSAPLTF